MTVTRDSDGFRLAFDDEIPEDERRFYLKVYPSVNLVTERKVHCTVCGLHIGTAPSNESVIRMHPILKVTHCKKCHEFYNSGEFSKGEDGSELYCRWCGQGGEVYCCSKCPYVFCTNCIVQNLTKDCVNDIEENENWNCFVCAPKIMWHLRAQHWALMNFIEKQKQNILDKNLTESSIRKMMTKDQSTCCKPKGGNVSDSSCDSQSSMTRKRKTLPVKDHKTPQLRTLLPKVDEDSSPEAKKSKTNNEVVCTPDVLSLIGQTAPAIITKVTPPSQQNNGLKEILPQERSRPMPPLQTVNPIARQIQAATTNNPSLTICSVPSQPQLSSIQIQTQANSPNPAPPLAIRSVNTNAQLRAGSPALVARKTIVGTRPPGTSPGQSPVYHTINGFRIDLNSAAQQETFRLPNGKLIQVKRQGTTVTSVNTPTMSTTTSLGTQSSLTQATRPPHLAQIQPIRALQANILNPQVPQHPTPVPQFTIQQPSLTTIRYAPATGQIIGANGAVVQTTASQQVLNQVMNAAGNPMATVAIRPAIQQPTLMKQIFASTPLGVARSQLQNQIFSTMDICQHLIGKIHSLTNSNAYKTARNYTDVKELYIHLSYLFTYAIGRFKTIQEKCMDDMRCLGFAGDAATLESGQLEKYASDNDEDDIVIVEPKTTLIDLDSDDEDTPRNAKRSPAPPKPTSTPPIVQKTQIATQTNNLCANKPPPLLIKPAGTSIPPVHCFSTLARPVEISQLHQPLPQAQLPVHQPQIIHTPPPQPLVHRQSPQILHQQSQQQSRLTPPAHHLLTSQMQSVVGLDDNAAISSPAQCAAPVESLDSDLDFTANLLAGMLDVELHEGTETVQITAPPKKPRKKTTNKPNPHLIKQQQIQAREREQELIKHDAKLNKQCLISLERIDDTNEDAKKKLEDYIATSSSEPSPAGDENQSEETVNGLSKHSSETAPPSPKQVVNGCEIVESEIDKGIEKSICEDSNSKSTSEEGTASNGGDSFKVDSPKSEDSRRQDDNQDGSEEEEKDNSVDLNATHDDNSQNSTTSKLLCNEDLEVVGESIPSKSSDVSPSSPQAIQTIVETPENEPANTDKMSNKIAVEQMSVDDDDINNIDYNSMEKSQSPALSETKEASSPNREKHDSSIPETFKKLPELNDEENEQVELLEVFDQPDDEMSEISASLAAEELLSDKIDTLDENDSILPAEDPLAMEI